MTELSLREPTFLILTALAAGAQHGYGIMTDVARISGGRVRLRVGTLYAALNRLAADAALARIHAPIGLEIGAVSPPEIAVAIMGEITARLRQSARATDKSQ